MWMENKTSSVIENEKCAIEALDLEKEQEQNE